MAYTTFSKRIKHFRTILKMTVRDLSKKSKIPYDTLISLENERNKIPTLITVMKLAKFYGVTIDQLIKRVKFSK